MYFIDDKIYRRQKYKTKHLNTKEIWHISSINKFLSSTKRPLRIGGIIGGYNPQKFFFTHRKFFILNALKQTVKIKLRGKTWKQIDELRYSQLRPDKTAVFISSYNGKEELTYFEEIDGL